MEQDTGDASLGEKKIKGFNTPVSIHVHSIRKRLTDPDGISAKAAIDGLVHWGILTDDTSKEVEGVSYSQEKGEPEQTIITLQEKE